MNKFKLFIDNFLVYGLGGVIGKIIPLIMLPILTRLMPSSFYLGMNDLFDVLISFSSSLAIMGMYDAMFRLYFENDEMEYKKRVCSTAFGVVLIVAFVIFIVLLLFKDLISNFVFGDVQYSGLLFLVASAVWIGSTNTIIQAPTRMQNKRKTYLFTNILGPVISYMVTIPMILRGHYLIALPLATVISAIIVECIYIYLNREWFSFKLFDQGIMKQLLRIGIPLLPNFLIYWVFNSSDRLMIAKLIGNEYTGIYTIGAKLGSVSQLIYVAFAGGWQYFAFSIMKEKEQVRTNSLIHEYLAVISYAVTLFVCALSYPIYCLLFEGEYILGHMVAPYLFFAPLLLMLFQIETNQFLVIKKTWPNIFILGFGAVINIILNFILIPVMKIEGAAIATLMGYIISNVICTIVLVKMKLMVISNRFLISTSLAIVTMLVWRFYLINHSIYAILLAMVISLIYVFLYRHELLFLLNKIKKR